MTTKIEASIELAVPATTAYDQALRFERYPRFLDGVVRVVAPDSSHLTLHVHDGDSTRELRLNICEHIPGKRIAWNSGGKPTHAGVVTFHRLSDTRSKVMLQVDYEPDDLAGKLADKVGLSGRRIRGGLDAFRRFVESSGPVERVF